MNNKDRANSLSREIIGSAIEVHRTLGPGLLESAYLAALTYELNSKAIPFRTQVALPVDYKGTTLDAGYRIDLLVDNLIIVEVKSVDKLIRIHEAQLLTYLKLTGKWLGLLVNFNVPILKQGIKRLVSGNQI
jgi:GxxExxY protein